jgi:hypothetical protein
MHVEAEAGEVPAPGSSEGRRGASKQQLHLTVARMEIESSARDAGGRHSGLWLWYLVLQKTGCYASSSRSWQPVAPWVTFRNKRAMYPWMLMKQNDDNCIIYILPDGLRAVH